MTFITYLPQLLRGPIAGLWGLRYARSVGETFDGPGEALLDASLLRGPLDAQDDALPYHGDARQIDRLRGEPIDAWRARLVSAWDLWPWAGTRSGFLTAIDGLGLTSYLVRTVGDFRPGLPPDRAGARWARWWAFVWGHPWTQTTWGSGTWGSGTWGSSASLDDVARVTKGLRRWSNARDLGVVRIFFSGSPAGWGLGTWGAGTWGATGAAYVDWIVE